MISQWFYLQNFCQPMNSTAESRYALQAKYAARKARMRVSKEKQQKPEKHKNLSDLQHISMKPRVNAKETDEVLCKFRKLQAENPIKTSSEEIVKLIREDRER
jgi:hypothetical protein